MEVISLEELEELDNAQLKKLQKIFAKAAAEVAEKVTYEESCYFFEYYRDMNASIPSCNYNCRLGPRDCNKNCPWYTDKADVDKIVREALNTHIKGGKQ